MVAAWEETPVHHLRLDVRSLLQDAVITEVCHPWAATIFAFGLSRSTLLWDFSGCSHPCIIRELKIWRRQRQRQRHKSMIWLVEWRKIIVLHVRHAFRCIVLTQSAKRRLEIFIFEVLMTTRARSSKSFTLCLYMKTFRTKLAKVQLAYFVQSDQHGIIAKGLT